MNTQIRAPVVVDDRLSLYRNIPMELRPLRQWVVWGVAGAPLKAPFNPDSLLAGRSQPAKAGESSTWGSLRSAAICVRNGRAQGVGFEFAGTELYGVDLDHVIDETGALTAEARGVVEALDTYTEISPSGNGLHLLVNAGDADIIRHRKSDGFVEIYNDLRYFTITGNVYGEPHLIESRSVELQRIHDKYLMTEPVRSAPVLQAVSPISYENAMAFVEIGLEKDGVFHALWNGERRCGNESSDDQALMNKLGYWCSADIPVMVRAFLKSPYHAQKDDSHMKKCRRKDYLPATAARACATLRSTARADRQRWEEQRQQRQKRLRSYER